MKRIMTICVAAAAALFGGSLTGCKDNKGKAWDANAMVSLRPATAQQGVASKANPEHLTPLEIVKMAGTIKWYNKSIWPNPLSRTFAEEHKDLVTPKLLMWGTDIITQMGDYAPDFIEGEDIVINGWDTITQNIDTIAYVPNSVIKAAQPLIKAAYDAGDYETCYSLFDKAFTFIPITGAEWRELKAKGKN